MQHVVIPPTIIGSVLTVTGVLIVIFHHWILKRVPERQSNWSSSRYVRNTPFAIVLFGVIVFVFGFLTLFRGGLQLF